MRSLQIFKIWGIPFKIHPYWFAVLFFFSWSISNQINLTSNEIYNIKEAWLIGFLTSFFFLSSIILQEIIHTFVSLNQGAEIKNITFYFLGAILQIEKDCKNALGNIKIALVRPILCFVIAIFFFLISYLSENKEQISINIISRIAILNLFLGTLNLLPIGSLDGGNLLKSIIWYFTGSKSKGKHVLNKINLYLSTLVLIIGLFVVFKFSFYYGLLITFVGIFGINASKSESQFFKIENILKVGKVSDLKINPLRRIEVNSSLVELNNLSKNQKNSYENYFFLTNNGRWDGFIHEDILRKVPVKIWQRTLVGDFKKPIKNFASVKSNTELWKTIELLETKSKGYLLVLNPADIPLGIIDRNKIGFYVLKKLGLNLPTEIIKKINFDNKYPLGMELPKIVFLMKKKGDIE